MVINSTAVALSRFNLVCSKIKTGVLVLTDTIRDLAKLRVNGFTAVHLAHIVHLPSEDLLETAVDLLRILTFGSPKARYILHKVAT
jgi:hypothetical protein